MNENVHDIPIDRIDPSPYQPRLRFTESGLDELTASIHSQGVLQPLLLRRSGDRYQVIAGERRLRAAGRAGLAVVPALIRDFSDQEALEAALIENLQREDLSAVETARAYERLVRDFGYTHAEVAARVGKSRVAVTNTMRILQLPEPVLGFVDRGELSEGHARALLQLPFPALQSEMAAWAVANAVTVRELERKARTVADEADRREDFKLEDASQPGRDPNLSSIEAELRSRFETKVSLVYRRGRGSITFEFYSDDDLQRILELLGVGD